MAKIPLYITGTALVPASSGNLYQSLGDGVLEVGTTLTVDQGSCAYYSAGTLSLLYARVATNAATASSTTVKTIITSTPGTGTTGNGLLSIAHGTTGEYSDAIDSDSITSGQEVGVVINNADSTGGVTFTVIAAVFAANSNTVKRFCGNEIGAGQSYSSASTTNPFSICGTFGTITEPKSEAELFVNGTLTNGSMWVSSNARGSASTGHSRIAGSNGNIAISITASTTGTFSDLSGIDTLSSSGTKVSAALTTGTGSGATIFWNFAVDLTTTDNSTALINSSSGTSQAKALTRYSPIAGNAIVDNAAATYQAKLQIGATLTNLTININTNGVTATSSISLAKGGSTSGLTSTVSISSGATGFLTDATGSDVLLATDELNYVIVTGNAGSTSLNYATISSKLAITTLTSLAGGTLMMLGVGV